MAALSHLFFLSDKDDFYGSVSDFFAELNSHLSKNEFNSVLPRALSLIQEKQYQSIATSRSDSSMDWNIHFENGLTKTKLNVSLKRDFLQKSVHFILDCTCDKFKAERHCSHTIASLI
ncbi:MAG: hypothetical protein ACK5WZ_01500, partial [Pseudobdellovibrionaceae bacterium]